MFSKNCYFTILIALLWFFVILITLVLGDTYFTLVYGIQCNSIFHCIHIILVSFYNVMHISYILIPYQYIPVANKIIIKSYDKKEKKERKAKD